MKKNDSDNETSDNEYMPAEDTTNMAVPEELELEQEKKKESDIVVIDN